ncbi:MULTISPECIES: hypothetical protein [Moorena]|uniref:hypothetical protein n=1 Tax=Moorena TaxID=1155738 RepID=UPI0002DE5259|nr:MULTISPECIES: hypothetical protein [Moorena]NEP30249.1 hypothetical protein [Moorena sp. SIO3B2]NEQ08097.1 hypothetical protein [Moorena sp. SIO4E2]NER88396.1 hypothetical protein [Moorena sp. SIO3A2]
MLCCQIADFNKKTFVIAVASDAARSWGASAVLGVPPMSNWRGFPHSRFAWLTGQLGHRH